MARCWNDNGCYDEGCLRQHPDGREERRRAARGHGQGRPRATSHTNGTGRGVQQPPDCRFRNNCSNQDCTRVHPDHREHARAQAKGMGKGGAANASFGPGALPNPLVVEPAHQTAGPLARMDSTPGQGSQAGSSEVSVFRSLLKLLIQTPASRIEVDALTAVEPALLRHQRKIADALPDDAQQVQVDSPDYRRWLELSHQLDAFLRFGSNAAWEHRCDQLLREKRRLEGALPALAARSKIVDWFRSSSKNLVIQGDTGSGKSTQVPQYLAEELGSGKRVICTQPRKMAAQSLAARVGEEWGGKPCVGFRVGGDHNITADMVIEYRTEESLLQAVVKNPAMALKGVGVIVLDEAHERTMKLDILVGRLKELQDEFNLRIVVTSATLDEQLFVGFLKSCELIRIAGRMYPVVDVYKPCEGEDMVAAVVDEAISLHKEARDDNGDFLIFLPGAREVDAAKDLFERKMRDKKLAGCVAMRLFGKQDSEDQMLVLQPTPPGFRKCIFATNVAETSITIDGVRWVIDSGREKREVYDPKRNICSLQEVFISRSSAMQRRGRAGRTSSGTCVRLYSEQAFHEMQQTQIAEVLSQPAFLSILTLLRMGLNPSEFKWVEAPADEVMESSWKLLALLGAVDVERQLTDVGSVAAELQINPHWAKVLAAGRDRGVLAQAADVVAAISVSSSFFADSKDAELRQKVKVIRDTTSNFGDVASVYGLVQRWIQSKREQKLAAFCAEHCIRQKSLLAALSTANELRRQLKIQRDPSLDFRSLQHAEVMDLVFSGYFSNLAVLVSDGADWGGAVYRVVPGGGTVEAVDAAVVFPGSNVTGLERPPSLVSFVALHTTSRVFMKGVLPLDMSWDGLVQKVEQLSASFADGLRAQQDSLCPGKATITDIPWSSLVGRSLTAIQEEVRDELEGTAHGDSAAGTVTVWCPRRLEQKAEDFLVKLRTRLREEFELAVHEECLGGGTRVVYGSGGKVHSILFPGEHMRWLIDKLPTATTLHSLRDMLAGVCGGALRDIRVMAGQGRAIVTFPSSTAAEVARSQCLSSYPMRPLAEMPVQSKDDSALRLICKQAMEVDAVLAWVYENLPNVDKERVIRPRANEIKPDGSVTVHFEQGGKDLLAALRRVRELEQHGITAEPKFCAVVSAPPQAAEHFHGECGSGAGCRFLDCLYRHPRGQRRGCRLKARCNRQNCRFLHPRSWYRDTTPLPAAPADTVLGVIQKGMAEGVTIVPESADGKVVLTIQSTNNTVGYFRDLLLDLLRCNRYEHDEASLLFTRLGVERRKSGTWPGSVVEDVRAQTLRVYGRPQEREATVAALNSIVATVKAQPCQRFVLRRNVLKPQAKGLEARQAAVEAVRSAVMALGAVEADVAGCILIVWASNDVLRGVDGELVARRWKACGRRGARQCFLCQDDFDDEVMQLRQCGHQFCRDCIRGYFSDPKEESVPLRCPMQSEEGPCCRELAWEDVAAACPKLSVVQQCALRQFLRTSEDAVECPRSTCDQVLRKTGGEAHCELCQETYCLHCSASTDRPVVAHMGVTCAEAQAAGTDHVQTHRLHIVERILTLRCPKCCVAFVDYDACAAVTCVCGSYFCAKCFKICRNSGHCHEHVKRCRGPALRNGSRVPASEGLYVRREEFDRIWNQVQTAEVKDYLSDLDPEMRAAVVLAMRSDFQGRPGGDITVDPGAEALAGMPRDIRGMHPAGRGEFAPPARALGLLRAAPAPVPHRPGAGRSLMAGSAMLLEGRPEFALR